MQAFIRVISDGGKKPVALEDGASDVRAWFSQTPTIPHQALKCFMIPAKSL